MKWRMITFLMMPLAFGACSEKAKTPNVSYIVNSHNTTTMTWEIDKLDMLSKMRTRYVVTCESYRSGDSEPKEGPDSCNLLVGDILTTRYDNMVAGFPDPPIVDIFVNPTNISIVTGERQNAISQNFSIVKASVVPWQ